MVEPMSPRLASAMTSEPGLAGRGHDLLEGGQAGRPAPLEEGHLGLDHRHHAGEGLDARQPEACGARRRRRPAPTCRAGRQTGRCRRTAARWRPPPRPPGRRSRVRIRTVESSSMGRSSQLAHAVGRRAGRTTPSISSSTRHGARGSRKVAVPTWTASAPAISSSTASAPGHHPADADDGGVGMGGPHVEHGPHGDRVDGRARQAPAGRSRPEHRRAVARCRWPCPAPC